MSIDWVTLGLQAVNVAILIWILARFFWRPLAAMIETMAIYCLVIALLLLFANPLLK